MKVDLWNGRPASSPDVVSTFFCCEAAALHSACKGPPEMRREIGWRAVLDEIRSKISRLLGVPSSYITFFHNSTAAIQRVLFQLNRQKTSAESMLVTTDIEYPGIIATIDDQWEGSLGIVEIADCVYSGRCEHIDRCIAHAAEYRPAVFLISHVDRCFGYALRPSTIQLLHECSSATTVVVDGTQAVGNVAVTPEFLENVDFYIGSTHKWLCGPPTLGFVVADPMWRIQDPAQSYSSPSGSRGAGSLEVLRGTNHALDEFDRPTAQLCRARLLEIARENARFATLFVDLLRTANIPLTVVGYDETAAYAWPRNGIVALTGNIDWVLRSIDVSGDPSRVEHCAATGRVMATLIGPELLRILCDRRNVMLISCLRTSDHLGTRSGGPHVSVFVPKWEVLRFCFHHFHSEESVRRLVDRLTRLAGNLDGG